MLTLYFMEVDSIVCVAVYVPVMYLLCVCVQLEEAGYGSMTSQLLQAL